MGQLPRALPKTVAMAEQAQRAAPNARVLRRLTDLLHALAITDSAFVSGGSAAVSPGRLRELVIITSTVAGRRWLRAGEGTPEVKAFDSLYSARKPPSLPELDETLSALLHRRFGRVLPARAAPGRRKLVRPVTP